MYKLHNTTATPLGLPGGLVTIQPHQAVAVDDQSILTHPVVINWIRAGRLDLVGDKGDPLVDTIGDDPPPESPRKICDESIQSIVDGNIADVVQALLDLTDEEFDAVVRAEKAGRARKGLSGPGGAFDLEWKRRYGIDD